jgi:hypothetical protein
MRFTGAKAVQNIIAGRVLIDVRVGKSLCTTFAAGDGSGRVFTIPTPARA